jgi:DNA-binding MarR family transcriptional regulator
MDKTKEIEELVNELFHKYYIKRRNINQMTQGKVLKILYKNGDLLQKDLQDILDIQSGSMSEMISKLEKKGFVLRKRDNQDKRKVLIHLTDLGKEDVLKYREHRQNHLIEVFNILDDNEKDDFIRLLSKILNK